MGQLKKLNQNALVRHTPIANKQFKTIAWHGEEMLVRPVLPLDDVFAFTAHVAELCTDDGQILPELCEMAFRQAVIEMYAAVDLPDSVEERYYYMFASDLYDTVVKYVNAAQLQSLRTVIELWLRKIIET